MDNPEGNNSVTLTLTTFECERCRYKFDKAKDYPPHLCYRCMQFLGKGTWKLSQQIQPPVSRPVESSI